MYSPKISEDLIPTIYDMAQKYNIPMTRVVDRILRNSLREKKTVREFCEKEYKRKET